MKKETAFVLVISVTVLSCAGYSSATVLGTMESTGAGSGLGEFSEMNFSIFYPPPSQSVPDFSTSLSWSVTEADVGKTLFASANTHETFDNCVSFLTNGVDDGLYLLDGHTVLIFSIGDGFLVTQHESTLISGIQDGVDFEGYTIDNIALTINELFLSYDADAIKGGLTNYSYDITYTINGAETIPNPEPATILLLGLGGITLLRRRERCSRMLI